MERFEEPRKQAEFVEVKDSLAESAGKSAKDLAENVSEDQSGNRAENLTGGLQKPPLPEKAQRGESAPLSGEMNSPKIALLDSLADDSPAFAAFESTLSLKRRARRLPIFTLLFVLIFLGMLASVIADPVFRAYISYKNETDPKAAQSLSQVVENHPDPALRMSHAERISEREPERALEQFKRLAASGVRSSVLYRRVSSLELKLGGRLPEICSNWHESLKIAGEQGRSPIYFFFPGYNDDFLGRFPDRSLPFKSLYDLLICGDYKYVSAISDQEFKDLHLRREQISFFKAVALREAGQEGRADKLFAQIDDGKVSKDKHFLSSVWSQSITMRIFCALDRGDIKGAYRLERIGRQRVAFKDESDVDAYSWDGPRFLDQAAAWVFFERKQYKVALGCLKEVEDMIGLDENSGLDQTRANRMQSQAALHFLRALIYQKMGNKTKATAEWSAFKKTGCDGKFFVPRPYRKLTDNQKLDD